MRTRDHVVVLNRALATISEIATRSGDPALTLAHIAEYAASQLLDVRDCRSCGRPFVYSREARHLSCQTCRWKRHLVRSATSRHIL